MQLFPHETLLLNFSELLCSSLIFLFYSLLSSCFPSSSWMNCEFVAHHKKLHLLCPMSAAHSLAKKKDYYVAASDERKAAAVEKREEGVQSDQMMLLWMENVMLARLSRFACASHKGKCSVHTTYNIRTDPFPPYSSTFTTRPSSCFSCYAFFFGFFSSSSHCLMCLCCCEHILCRDINGGKCEQGNCLFETFTNTVEPRCCSLLC